MRQQVFGKRVTNKTMFNDSNNTQMHPNADQASLDIKQNYNAMQGHYGFKKIRKSDEIDFQICGDSAQYVIIELDPNEGLIADAGSMICIEKNISMTTIMGDASEKEAESGFLSKMLNSGKRILSGEGLFITLFMNDDMREKRKVTLSGAYSGNIIPVDLAAEGGTLICQKQAFLCAAKGVSIGIHLQKKISFGLFGGDGFIMQKLDGDGLAFIHAGGNIFTADLDVGETMRVDTGCLVAYQPSVTCNITTVKGISSMLFGGEGIFLAEMTGPGRVWVQTMPLNRLRSEILRGSKAD